MITQLFSITIRTPIVIEPDFFDESPIHQDMMFNCMPLALYARRPRYAPPPGVDSVEWIGAKASECTEGSGGKRVALSQLFTEEEVELVETWLNSLPPCPEHLEGNEIEGGRDINVCEKADKIKAEKIEGLWYCTPVIEVSEDLEVWCRFQPYLHALVLYPSTEDAAGAIRVDGKRFYR